MKVMLLFPPYWAFYQPYLSLPSLTSVLREKGYEVIQKDVNIEWVDYINSTVAVKEAYRKIQDKVKFLNSLENKSDRDEEIFKNLLLWDGIYKNLLSLVKASKDVMKNEKTFFDFDLYHKSRLLLLKVHHMMGDVYYPTMIDFHLLRQKYKLSPDDIMEAVNDREGNIHIDYFEKHVIPSIRNEGADFYGISIASFTQIIPGLTLAYMIKKNFPNAHVSIGGTVFTRIGPKVTEFPKLFDLFDSIIMYEGEVHLLKLLKAIEHNEEFDELPGIIYKGKNGKIVFNKKIEKPDINTLPPPDFDGLPLEKYQSPFTVLPLLSSRGCYWNKCTFCQHKNIYHGRYGQRKMEYVINDIKTLNSKYGCRYISFCDEAISVPRLKELAKGIIAEDIQIFWEAYAKAEEKFDREVADLLYKAGCRMLSFGLESSSQRVLNLMKKGIDITVFERVLKCSSEAGIWNYVWFFTGFPSETEDEARETVNFILRNQEYIHAVPLGPVFTLEEYTDIMENPSEFSIDEIKPVEGNDLVFMYDYRVSRGMGQEETLRLSEELGGKIREEHRNSPVMSTMARVHQLLYVTHFGTNKLRDA